MPPRSRAMSKARVASPFQSESNGTASPTPIACAQARCDQTESREMPNGRTPAVARSVLLSRRSANSSVQSRATSPRGRSRGASGPRRRARRAAGPAPSPGAVDTRASGTRSPGLEHRDTVTAASPRLRHRGPAAGLLHPRFCSKACYSISTSNSVMRSTAIRSRRIMCRRERAACPKHRRCRFFLSG